MSATKNPIKMDILFQSQNKRENLGGSLKIKYKSPRFLSFIFMEKDGE